MSLLPNHNLEHGTRHKKNEFYQNVRLTFFFNKFYYDMQNIFYESN